VTDKSLKILLHNRSTIVPDDRSQCFYRVLPPIIRCAFGAQVAAQLDVGLAKRSWQHRADLMEISRFIPSFLGEIDVFYKT